MTLFWASFTSLPNAMAKLWDQGDRLLIVCVLSPASQPHSMCLRPWNSTGPGPASIAYVGPSPIHPLEHEHVIGMCIPKPQVQLRDRCFEGKWTKRGCVSASACEPSAFCVGWGWQGDDSLASSFHGYSHLGPAKVKWLNMHSRLKR